jgi:eukaryotic-like serine/threonine-protein kinase
VIAFAPAGTTLVRALGAGTVFELALVEREGQRLLCKRLKERLVGERAAENALERERTVLERAKHPSLPRLHDTGRDDRGPWLLESAVDGVPLRVLVESRIAQGASLPSAMVRRVGRRAFAVLAELHALADDGGPFDLVHGDLSPDHLLVGKAQRGAGGGDVGFVDFGLARWRGMAPELCGDERGTLPFVAPEIARGERAPDQAGDVYALAAVLAFAVLGRDPVKAPTSAGRLVEVAEQGVELDALWQAEPESRLLEVLLRALAFDERERLGSAAEAARMLG